MNKQYPAEGKGRQDGMAGSPASRSSIAAKGPGSKNQAVLGPFTIRDLAVFAAGLLLFVASLLPLFAETFNLWSMGSLFSLALGILLPLIVVALFVARRLTPQTSLRLGSLSVDQFASVVASYTLGFFFLAAAAAFAPTLMVGLLGAILLFAATVLGRFIPFFAGDFLNRAEAPAHVVARDAAVPDPAPRAARAPVSGTAGNASVSPSSAGPAATWKAAVAKTAAAVASVSGKPDAGEPSSVPPAAGASTSATAVLPPRPRGGQDAGAGTSVPQSSPAADDRSAAPPTAVTPQVRQQQPLGATVDPATRPEPDEQPTYEAFWFAVPQPRTAVDPRTGAPAFVVEPGGWVLALEDRGNSFLIQHSDGRVGVLHDLSNIERG